MKEYNTIKHDRAFNSQDCSSIEYELNGSKCYGIIINFFKINSDFFCLVRKLERINSDYFLNSLTDLLKKYFFKFFNLVSLSEHFELVKFENSINRIILINNDDNFIISSVIKTDEKD